MQFGRHRGYTACAFVQSKGSTEEGRKAIAPMAIRLLPRNILPRCMQRGLATRKLYVCHPSVPPSVCPSVKRLDCDKTEESSAQFYT